MIFVEDPQTPEQLSLVHEQLWQTVLQFGNLSAMQERNRIARDLHDSLGQALTALNIQLQTAVKLWQLDPEQSQRFLEEAQRLGTIAVKEVRQTVHTLRTDTPEAQSLDALIESLVQGFHQLTGVMPATLLDLPTPLPAEMVTPLYRIAQEALNNICKYAQATEVQIGVHATSEQVCLTVQDNGRGFNPADVTAGFGLRGMQERAAILGGEFQVETEPGSGCRITVRIPWRRSPRIEPETPKPLPTPLPAPAEIKLQPPLPPPLSKLAETELADVEEALITLLPAFVEAKPKPPLPTPPSALVEVEPKPPLPSSSSASVEMEVEPEPLSLPPSTSEELPEPSSLLPPTVLAPLESEELPEPSSLLPPTVLAPLEFAPCFSLPLQQKAQLEKILATLIGPIAPTLIQQVLVQVQDCQELIDQLLSHIALEQRAEFKQRAAFLLESASEPVSNPVFEPVSNPVSNSVPDRAADVTNDTLSEAFISQCEQALTDAVGPIASLLIQRSLKLFPQLSPAELIEALASNISNPQKSAQFRQRLSAHKKD